MSALAFEVDRFDRLSAAGWDRRGPMRPLHVINRLRLAYLLDLIGTRLARQGRSVLGLRRGTSVNRLAALARPQEAPVAAERVGAGPSRQPSGAAR